MKRLQIVAAVLAIAVMGLVGCTTIPTEYREPAPLAAETRSALNLRVHDRVWTLVRDNYFDEKFRGVDWIGLREKHRTEAAAAPDDTALYRVLGRLCAELKQSHLAALPPRTVHEKATEHRAAAGLRWLNLEDKRVVTDVIPGGAAAEAGVQPGWLIQTRDGRAIDELEIFVSKLGQPVGFTFLDLNESVVALTLEPRLLDFERQITRELPGGYRYVRFDRFTLASLRWLSAELKTHRTAPGVIIDLRQNPGGNVAANQMAVEEFFDQPKPVAMGRFVRRGGKASETNGFGLFSAHYAGKVMILIGPGSASASEIFAHVMQQEKRATVVGRRSAGAVIVSRFYRLPGGGQLQVPIQDYVGRDGLRLEGRGVTPDIVVPAPTIADWRVGRDVDLEAVRDAGALR